MRLKTIFGGGLAALALSACSTLSSDVPIAEYCADADNASEAVCRLKVEIDGNSTALSDTNLSLSEARSMAEGAMSAAESAQSSADSAMSRADEAYSMASEALSEEDLQCETRVVQQSNIGTCEDGYTVMGCTQTRYTHRAGGLSFLREVTNEQCRFNSQVLEMNVRCCKAATADMAASDS